MSGNVKKPAVGQAQPSDELAAVTRRWVEAIEKKDGRALSALFSDSPVLRYIGTDRDEIFAGSMLREGYGRHVGELPDFRMTCERLEAFAQGEVGWAIWLGSVQFTGRPEVTLYRFSLVFTLDAGIWKIVHVHVSNPRSNVEVWGGEHQVFQRLIQAARSEDHDFGVEGTATIMFTDIANSTSLAAFMGDRAWAKSIAGHFAQLRAIIEERDGRVIKTLGDGTMSSFTSARAATLAAQAIQLAVANAGGERPLRIRIGLHTGDVVQADGDFFGSVVNKAARIAAIAEPGATLVSEVTRAMAGEGSLLAFGPLQPVQLHGIAGDQLVCRLLPSG